MEPEPFNLISA